ncbi:bacteriocin immunity protein [Pseudomonas kermanshahensis]|uniref:Bacteriocin immunity protein n=1 Tax=Pseudomonas kermanshahensis TaxID=2745482 RepID=A0ABU8R792_9PSED|nr:MULTISPECIES: bacteriocin immunity protein [Pseudomonas]ATP46702.1 bacteriocin immunity protein [Pseudomonas putida]MBC3485339.1 bacteriocin immunity protein [Pseudomonas sp. SWRI50]MBC3494954.1 bacteriocin immunity protein [Pseudomonas sp. SWRI67]MBV4528617.1 bacteriocin immunity protein [Pseudomonas kermanshahensis]
MTPKNSISEFTELEFLEFITSITNPPNNISEQVLDSHIMRFKSLSEHPNGSDLIYWPEADGLDTPEEIVRIIKEWRAANGKPGFKAE